ncbi:MAG TPA: glycoside hydrolase family 6 protein [Stackebrandtia sp.]|jgi:endoglucanase|uniref:glycoside hydrolase family 6 protein n=1 Tax=Stackebrandtia sp. TaxID=2023065 RepID=UPI002D263D29|nr:glycoside hydrolase family 6 protein [Stackebrandtia sp.]HZE41172.1 glycoside hydrolase family 6 protein [Stackebrandtia sp.]
MKKKTALIASLALAAACVPAAVTYSAFADDDHGNRPAALDGEFYANPGGNAATWVKDNPDSPNADAIKSKIAERPGANWYGTQADQDWPNTPVDQYVADAAQAGKTPILVAYNMYQRDCGGQSQGGASSPDKYKAWIDDFASGIGDGKALVVLEPDAVAQMVAGNCDLDVNARKELLKYAVDALASRAPNASTYLDAGTATWPGDAGTVAGALKDADVSKIRGFALNTSNFYTTEESDKRGADINQALGGDSHYVVDTSRNGSGHTQDGDDSWCNPKGATLGEASTVVNDGADDAHLWIKAAGDSDGDCGYGAGVPAGQFSEKLAMALITGDYDG